MTKINNIEDCLELAAGLRTGDRIVLEKEDITIMHSIARQSFKGTALTDRQFDLMKIKLSKYRDQFNLDNFDIVINKLRQPLRQIDRSKYIKIVDQPAPDGYNSDDTTWIKIRFPFKKSDIMSLQEISHTDDYRHAKGSHEHFFALTEKNIFNIIDKFKDKNFDIDNNLLEIYKEIVNIQKNKKDFICGFYDDNLLNLNKKLKDIVMHEVGPLSSQNKLQYIDRRHRYGIEHIKPVVPKSTLEKIVYRDEISYHSKPSAESISDLLSSLWQLDRFPLLAILDKKYAEEQLHEMITFYRDILQPETQSVLFRQEGNSGFNQLIKDRRLNNWVDNNTKIVYISSDKLPKLLLKDTWTPLATISYTSTIDMTVEYYSKFNCDLVVYREEHLSPMRRHSRYYG